MKKIAWITAACFIDVDLPIIKTLNIKKQFEIDWFLVYTKNRVTTYDQENIENEVGKGYIDFKHLYLDHRMRTINTLFKLFILCIEIKKSKPKIVYVNCAFEPYFTLLLKLILGSKKVIYAIHDVEPHVGSSKIIRLFLELKIKMFNNFHVFSTTQKNLFLSKYGKLHKRIFYTPLFLKHFGVSKMVPPKDIIRFLFFGTIRKNKGLEYLIEATNKLSDEYNGRFIVQIAGKCNEWSIYENLIKDFSVFELSIEAVPNEKIADLFCKSHYLVLPYKDITQSGPLMIAFDYRVPTIASNLPGFVENINDMVTGYLFQTENSESLYNVMSKVIDNHEINYQFIKNNLNVYIQKSYCIENINGMYADMFEEMN